MNAFMGADTEALRTMGTVCARRAELLADLVTHLAATVDGVEWIGEDADRFRADWTGRGVVGQVAVGRRLDRDRATGAAGAGDRAAPAGAPPAAARR